MQNIQTIQTTGATFRALTNIDVAVLVKELRQYVGSRVDKIYQLGPSEFVFRFKGLATMKDLLIFLPYAFAKIERQIQEKEPTTFAMTLRKHLENKVLLTIEQPNIDRVCIMKFDGMQLAFEMFGNGNVILFDDKGMIISILKREETKQRTLTIGTSYVLPEMKKKKVSAEGIKECLESTDNSEEKLIVVLSKNFNIPAFYLNEILPRNGIEPTKKVKEFEHSLREKIADVILKFFERVTSGNVNIILRSDGSYVVSDMAEAEKEGVKVFNNFMDLLAEVYKEHLKIKQRSSRYIKVEKLLKKLKHQEEHLPLLKNELAHTTEMAQILLAHKEIIEEIIERYKQLRKQKKSTEEIKKELSNICTVDIVDGKLLLELTEN
jgi:predicted ribosome quality control (RQC) complex YloA/Tae2 family protein